jgi:very-short-patch-repair endonuclease
MYSMTVEFSKAAFLRHYYKARGIWFRWNRLLFPSAAEARFIEIMGGHMITFGFIKHPETKQPFRIILSIGRALKREHFGREIKAGKYWLDFGNDIFWCIEIDGKKYHRDIVREQERDEYLSEFCHKRCRKPCYKHSNQGWRVKHIPALRLWLEPAIVQREVLNFLNT